ncbi:hypothetical protein [Methylophaga thiooxydans]|uniref:Uncharacterized protein n=1 Tax=Methylophaga thiooxydans DMS010 TaxID=637616 RepID=C0N768_9GAMM|nr:hypothetical protein [Methylophaga thiooxydans]EEF79163.1 hypothetical protein MDMS009_1750 [Methylophaga thiooxydans DMS010]
MENPQNDQVRAQLISTLWSLKSAITLHPDAIKGLGYVHFNTLIKDEDYRLSILNAAIESPVEEVRKIGQTALDIHIPGPLSKNPSEATTQNSSSSSHASDRENNDSANHNQSSQPSKHRASIWLRSIVIFLLFGGMTSAAISGWLWNSDIKIVEGSINESVNWQADKHYILSGLVFVESGATLSIEAGTKISGSPGSALIVTRDAKINAQGRSNAPIVFTSKQAEGKRQRGDWGGLVLLGNAPINKGTAHIEGIKADDPRGGYGGMADTDSCGVLKYVRVEFAGYEISQDNELNGLTLGGCGSGTIINHVQVHMGLDDGVEVFGGTVNLKHIFISHPGDDGLDWDQGWQGKAQFVIVHQGPDGGDNGIEADNDKNNHHAAPRSQPTLSNISLIGSGHNDIAQRGLLLRRGTAGDLRNFLITGFTTEALDLGDESTAALVVSKQLTANGWVIQHAEKHYFSQEFGSKDDDNGFSEQAWLNNANNLLTSRELLNAKTSVAGAVPDFAPRADSAAAKIFVPLPQDEFWDEGANYTGAIRPGERISWLDGWTAYPVH